MAKLPTKEALGELPSARSGRHIAEWDTSAAGRGAMQAGRSVAAGSAALGRALASAARTAAIGAGTGTGTRTRRGAVDPNTVFEISSFLSNEQSNLQQLQALSDTDELEDLVEKWQAGFRQRARELARKTPGQYHQYLDSKLLPWEEKTRENFEAWRFEKWPSVISSNLGRRYEQEWYGQLAGMGQAGDVGPAAYGFMKDVEGQVDEYLDAAVESEKLSPYRAEAIRKDIMNKVVLGYFNALPDHLKDKAIGMEYVPVAPDRVEEVTDRIEAAGKDGDKTALGLVGAGVRPGQNIIDKVIEGKAESPAMSKWVDAHLNTLISKMGLKGTGSYAGKALLERGKAVNPKDAKAGKTLVIFRDPSGELPHVRMFDGFNPDGSVRTLAPFLVSGKPDTHLNFNMQFGNRLHALLSEARKHGFNVNIQSGTRSIKRQGELYEASKNAAGVPSGRVAAPGRSRHNHGIAADLNYGGGGRWGNKGAGAEAQKWIHANAARFGLHFRMMSKSLYEPWHIEPMDAAEMMKRGDFPKTASYTVGSGAGVIVSTARKYNIRPDLALAIVQIESNFDPKAKNKASSASGYYQIISSTAKSLGITDVFDPWQNADGGARLTRKNIDAFIRDIGREPSDGEVYLMHFMGYGGATRLLKSITTGKMWDPQTPVSKVVSPMVIKANPFLRGKSVAEVIAWADAKMATALGEAKIDLKEVTAANGDIEILGFREAPPGVNPAAMEEAVNMVDFSASATKSPMFDADTNFMTEHMKPGDIEKWIKTRRRIQKEAVRTRERMLRTAETKRRRADQLWKDDPALMAAMDPEFQARFAGKDMTDPKVVQDMIRHLYQIQERRPGMVRPGMAPLPRKWGATIANDIFNAVQAAPFDMTSTLEAKHEQYEKMYGEFTDEVMKYAISTLLKDKDMAEAYADALSLIVAGKGRAARAPLLSVDKYARLQREQTIFSRIFGGTAHPYDDIDQQDLRKMASNLGDKAMRKAFIDEYGDDGEEALDFMDAQLKKAKGSK